MSDRFKGDGNPPCLTVACPHPADVLAFLWHDDGRSRTIRACRFCMGLHVSAAMNGWKSRAELEAQ